MCESRTTSASRTSPNRASSASQARAVPRATSKIAQLCSTRWIVPSGPDLGLGEVAQLVLDHRELADPIGQRRAGRQPVGQAGLHPADRLATAGGEDLVHQVVAADGLDRRQEAGGQAVVVRREEVLGLRRDVVQVTRPADPVALGPAHDQLGRFEGPQLLQDAGPAGAEPHRQLVRRRRPDLAQEDHDVPAQGRPLTVAVRAAGPGVGSMSEGCVRAGSGLVHSRHGPKASTVSR